MRPLLQRLIGVNCFVGHRADKPLGAPRKYRFPLEVAVETHVSTCARLDRGSRVGPIFQGALSCAQSLYTGSYRLRFWASLA